MHVHILSLVVKYESKHKKSLTPLFGRRQNKIFCSLSKQRGRKIEAKFNICFLFFIWNHFFFVLPRVQNGTIRCRLPLCMCMFGFRAMLRQRPMIKVRSHSPEHPSPNSHQHPPPPHLFPFLIPQTPPVGGSSMTRGCPPHSPRPQAACTFLLFRLFRFCFVLYFFVKSKTRQINEQFSKKQKQKKRLDYVC